MSVLPTFDPRIVPVEAVDHHLPPVQLQSLQGQAIRQRFASPPVWVPELHSDPRLSSRALVQAAVLVPLVMRDVLTVLLTERTTQLTSHSGQVAFPGGKVDPEDASLQAAALREAQEEIGLKADFIEIIGKLPIYTTGTAVVVTPVVALIRPGFEISANPHEVAAVFEVPLDFLMNPANHRRHAVHWEGARREWLSMPYQDAGVERFIWGATAAMLRNLYAFLSAPV